LAILLQQFLSLQQSPFRKKKKTCSNLPPAISLQSKNPSSKSLASSFSESFKSSSKQGGGAAVLRKGHGTEQEKLVFLLLNNLGKAAELHLAFSLSSAAGAVPNLSLQII
jgi:hypothetical protein